MGVQQLGGARALVTGASSGIGREVARALAAKGARLALVARRTHLLEELADELESDGSRPLVITADLSERGRAAAVAEQVLDELEGVDVLVNNAGGGVGGVQWAVGDRDEAREAFEINFWSPLALTQRLVPGMRERKRGAVVNVTSGAQVTTWPSFGHYAATKAAFAVATETLRMELHGSGVDAIEVVAGPIDTAIQAESKLIPGFEKFLEGAGMGDPATMARLIVRAIERGTPRFAYPRRAGIAIALPTVTRRLFARSAAKLVEQIRADDPTDALSDLVVRSGSMGDPMARGAREEWERERGLTQG